MRKRKKISVAFLWHMHQPMYKDFLTGKYYLPWVRLHATYSYYDMVKVLEDYPNVKCTFNLTPSLIYQLKDMSQKEENIDDIYLKLTRKEPKTLSDGEKVFILKYFFSCHEPTQIAPLGQYKELFERRGLDLNEKTLLDKIGIFSVQDYRDMQTFFNLSWCGYTLKDKDDLVRRLVKKNGNYTEKEKNDLIDKQMDIVRSILPLYKEAQDKGQIEVSTTPYYHPILPLLCKGKTDEEGFYYKPDAKWHVEEAIKLYKEVFGKAPVGMWPAEGSVSQEVVPLFAAKGIKWIATDEAIAFKSLGHCDHRDEIVFSAHNACSGTKKVGILFRDINLSNDVSFKYSSMDPEVAAKNLFTHFIAIRNAVKNKKESNVIPVILDGENPWPYFPDGGKGFLQGIYGRLNKGESILPVTIGGYFKKNAPHKKIKKLAAGSWINGDFAKWIGSPNKKKAWEYLSKVRKDVFKEKKISKEVLRELYTAESSDWFWWYDEFGSELNYVFDDIYRMHLKNIYKLMGKQVPHFLHEALYDMKAEVGGAVDTLMSPPEIDGRISYDYEWVSAETVNFPGVNFSMVQTDLLIKELSYGMDRDNLYVMVVPTNKLKRDNLKNKVLEISVASPLRGSVEIPFGLDKKGSSKVWDIEGDEYKEAFFMTFAFNEVLEAKIPFAVFGADQKDDINFRINLKSGDDVNETWPLEGFFRVIVPESR